MYHSTLCYIENDHQEYLMLHRVKKKNDVNHDKWVGIGGKFEPGENAEKCLKREVMEETGLTLHDYTYHGIVTFLSDQWEGEYMHLFSSKSWSGTIKECDEGNLEWVRKDAVPSLPIWTGDKIFFSLMENQNTFFHLTLQYEGDTLIKAVLEGVELSISDYQYVER